MYKGFFGDKKSAYENIGITINNATAASLSLKVAINNRDMCQNAYVNALTILNNYIRGINITIKLSDCTNTEVSSKKLSNDSFLQNITEILDKRPAPPSKDAMGCETGKMESQANPNKCIYRPNITPNGYTYDSETDIFSQDCSSIKDSNDNPYVDINFMYCAEDCTKMDGNYVEKVPSDVNNSSIIPIKVKDRCWKDCSQFEDVNKNKMEISKYNMDKCRTKAPNDLQEERWALFSWMKDYASGFEQFFGIHNIAATYGDAGTGLWWVPNYLPKISAGLPDIPLISNPPYYFPYKYGDGPNITYNVLNTDIKYSMPKSYSGARTNLMGMPTFNDSDSTKVYDAARSSVSRKYKMRDMILRTDLSRYNPVVTTTNNNYVQTVFDKIVKSDTVCPTNDAKIKYDTTNLSAGCIPVLNNTFMTVKTEGAMSHEPSILRAYSTVIVAENKFKNAVEATFPSNLPVIDRQKKWVDWLKSFKTETNPAGIISDSVKKLLDEVNTARAAYIAARRGIQSSAN